MNIENYLKEVKKKYRVYFCKDVPISEFKNYNFFNPSLSYAFLNSQVEKYGIEKSKKLILKMIKTAEKHHLGYEKTQYEKIMNTESFSWLEWAIYDWIKTYAYVKKYCEFLLKKEKFEYPLIAFTETTRSTGIHIPEIQLTIHPGTVRMRCTQYLYFAQKIDTKLDFLFYTNTEKDYGFFKNKKLVDTVEDFVKCYGYETIKEVKNDKEILFETKQHPDFQWLAKPNYIEKEHYMPYLLEAYYHLFTTKTFK